MIFLDRARLAILSEPKTGTVALETALGPLAAIVMTSPPKLKHIRYPDFLAHVAPLVEAQCGLKRADYDVVSVMREPLDWFGSWYRYRSRPALANPADPRAIFYTGGISFAQFIEDVCKPFGKRPRYAQMDPPCSVALSAPDRIGVDRLFPYEDLAGLYDLVAERTGKPVELKRLNVSPERPLDLSDALREKLREAYPFAFTLHASLDATGHVAPRFR